MKSFLLPFTLLIIVPLAVFNLTVFKSPVLAANITTADFHSLVPPCADTGPDCHFGDLVTLVSNVINYLLFYILLPLAALSLSIAGCYYLFSADNEARRSEAKKIIWAVLKGFLLAFAAWVIVITLLKFFVSEDIQSSIKAFLPF